LNLLSNDYPPSPITLSNLVRSRDLPVEAKSKS
jgi:hypothetical protein